VPPSAASTPLANAQRTAEVGSVQQHGKDQQRERTAGDRARLRGRYRYPVERQGRADVLRVLQRSGTRRAEYERDRNQRDRERADHRDRAAGAQQSHEDEDVQQHREATDEHARQRGREPEGQTRALSGERQERAQHGVLHVCDIRETDQRIERRQADRDEQQIGRADQDVEKKLQHDGLR
jgi:hypothetical protein